MLICGHVTDADPPPDWSIEGVVAVLRCVDSEGQRRVLTVYAGDVMTWEALAMVGVAEIDVRRHLERAPTISPDLG